MKNKLVVATFFLIAGLVAGNNIYNKIDLDILETFKEENNYYLLQEGIYDTKESMQSETRDINPKIYEEKNNKYYVYVGISSNLENAQKIEKIYTDNGIDITVKKIKINDEEFINNITQFDILISNTNNTDEILTIEEVVLSSYSKKILG